MSQNEEDPLTHLGYNKITGFFNDWSTFFRELIITNQRNLIAISVAHTDLGVET